MGEGMGGGQSHGPDSSSELTAVWQERQRTSEGIKGRHVELGNN